MPSTAANPKNRSEGARCQRGGPNAKRSFGLGSNAMSKRAVILSASVTEGRLPSSAVSIIEGTSERDCGWVMGENVTFHRHAAIAEIGSSPRRAAPT